MTPLILNTKNVEDFFLNVKKKKKKKRKPKKNRRNFYLKVSLNIKREGIYKFYTF